jgi:chromosome segregation ATPase
MDRLEARYEHLLNAQIALAAHLDKLTGDVQLLVEVQKNANQRIDRASDRAAFLDDRLDRTVAALSATMEAHNRAVEAHERRMEAHDRAVETHDRAIEVHERNMEQLSKEIKEIQKDSDDRLNALIQIVDDLVCKRPPGGTIQ